MKRISLMEYVWIAIAIISAIIFVDAYLRFGWTKAKTFLIFVGIAVIMYLWRRLLRKSQE